MYIMSLSPAPFSGETAGAIARAADPATLSQEEIQLVASGDKVTGGRKSRKYSRKARKSSRKARKANRKSRRRA